MAEQRYSAADFEGCAARLNGGGVWNIGDDAILWAALNRAANLEREGLIEGALNDLMDVPPELDSEPLGFHQGWETCARMAVAAIRRAARGEAAPLTRPAESGGVMLPGNIGADDVG